MTRNYKPSEYLRQRRPEKYSDSIQYEQPKITQDILEYHLDTLTSRSQEKEFEHFARKVSEKEICPNLVPQTGPTGGGDSKVDSETFPVSESISIRWYLGNAAANNRWAFAFSAKKDWKTKVKDDVKKIALTERDYKLIYFVTNQFARDKDRAEIEDSLGKEFGIPLRILDRSWIIDRVFNHGCQEIAATTLSIESLQLNSSKKIGPLDASREVELQSLDKEIADPERYAGINYQLAEDCLTSAVLASELERNRSEVDGRFAAALRIAEKVGDTRQILRIRYRQAWVSCFVYDDIAELSKLYDDVERLGLSSSHTEDIELVNNLWNVLFGSNKLTEESNERFKLAERRNALKAKLTTLANEEARPNNALHAKTLLCFHKFFDVQLQENAELDVDEVFEEFNVILEGSRGLGLYPFDSFKEILYEIGDAYSSNQAYDNLFNTIVSIQQDRTTEGDTGVALTNRGIQKFRAGKLYEAIKLLGKAQEKLIKDEYKRDLVRCLIASGGCYKSAGLYWAARSSLLAALSICITEHQSSGSMMSIGLIASKELAYIELQLGRVPHILFSISLNNFISSHLSLDEEEEKSYGEFIVNIDALISMLLLRLNLDQLAEMTKIPYVLDQVGLVCSEGAMLFALGHIEKLKGDVWFTRDCALEEVEKFYETLSAQPVNDELMNDPQIYEGEKIILSSNVLGMTLKTTVGQDESSILIGESIIGALEAFLATSLSGGITPHKQNPTIAINADDKFIGEFGLKLNVDNKEFDLVISHKKNFAFNTTDEIHNFKDFIRDCILELLRKTTFLDGGFEHFKSLLEEESVISRALIFSDIITLSHNVFGNLDWINLSKLNNSIQDDAYPLLRKIKWNSKNLKKKSNNSYSVGEGDAPDSVRNMDNIKHHERKLLSLIDISEWNKAQWSGSLFMVYPQGQFPPCIGLMFRDQQSARNIFEGWLKRIGKRDVNEELRVSIITGVDKKNPSHYRIHIGTNIEAYEKVSETGQFLMVSRINTMTPADDKNLNMFLAAYKEAGAYCLLPAYFLTNQMEPEIIRDLFLIKKSLTVKPAWQISENDYDFMVLTGDDDPLIPDGIVNAPVIKAIKKKKSITDEHFKKGQI